MSSGFGINLAKQPAAVCCRQRTDYAVSFNLTQIEVPGGRQACTLGISQQHQHRPGRVAMAVPVASGPGLRRLGRHWEVHAPEVVEPPDFMAVGRWYEDFDQTSDQEVIDLLARAHLAHAARASD